MQSGLLSESRCRHASQRVEVTEVTAVHLRAYVLILGRHTTDRTVRSMDPKQ